MKYIGEHYGFVLYVNTEGFIEGYKSSGGRRAGLKNLLYEGRDIKRIVSKAEKIEDFFAYIKKTKAALDRKQQQQQPTKTILICT